MISLVLGMNRSGTSAPARLLNLAGLAFRTPEGAVSADISDPHDLMVEGTAISLRLSDEATAMLNRSAAVQRSLGGVVDSPDVATA